MRIWNDLSFWETTTYSQLVEKLMKSREGFLPKAEHITRAFDLTPFNRTRVVILGQDPYHTPGVADGLAFSTWPTNRIPPSLSNIFKEYQNDLRLPLPRTGDLSSWAEQGVLLLNTCLTVSPGKAGSHRHWGWEKLTIEVISRLSERGNCVFILWGRDAGEYKGLVDVSKNLTLQSVHPSPLSARKGFFGSAPFSTTNFWLESCGERPIDWRLR